MTDRHPPKGETEFREEQASLVRITLGPLTWAVHFVVSYAATAVFCAKLEAPQEAIAWLGWRAWRQWREGNEDIWEDPAGSNEDRHQFLGHAALLLAAISFIGVVYTALPALLSASCR